MALRRVLIVTTMLVVCGLTLGSCSQGTASGQADRGVVVQETGSIDSGDTRDPNHSNLAYDAYTFEAKAFDRVRVAVLAENFTPLLKLVEVETGAPLWEWEAQYSDEDALVYTIAGSGTYEARVYAIDGGMGTYQITVTLDD